MFEMIKKLDIKNMVHVIKNPPRDDVIAAYRETEFLVLPSRWELSPLTPLEGFVFKKSIISTNVHGIPSTINNGENCILIENEDFEELATQIMKLINDPDMCIKLGEAGYNMVQNECNSKSMTEKILNVYNKLINR
jgi:glycosyltransferase involved in cell wall biosynthesis